MNKIGYAVYKRGSLYFDYTGWSLLKKAARKHKKSPKFLVQQALFRCARKHGKKMDK